MVVSVAGGVTHNQALELSEKSFGGLKKESVDVTGEDRPLLTGSLIQIRDDDVDLAHCGVFYNAPSWNDEDFFSFQILRRLFDNFVPERDSIINHPHLQYNHLYKFLGEMEDMCEHSSHYFSYSDCGLFGNYGSTIDVSSFLIPVAFLKCVRRATSYVSDAEMYRSRNKYYNQLL
jgi:predicted Zn-dependent peptidase